MSMHAQALKQHTAGRRRHHLGQAVPGADGQPSTSGSAVLDKPWDPPYVMVNSCTGKVRVAMWWQVVTQAGHERAGGDVECIGIMPWMHRQNVTGCQGYWLK